jgi:Two-component sensor kinase N-terminal
LPADLAALAQQSDTGLHEARRVSGLDNRFAQLLTPRAAVVDSTPSVAGRHLLTARELDAAKGHAGFVTRTFAGEAVRLFALPIRAQGQELFVVVGASLQPRMQALSDLRRGCSPASC